MRIAGYIISFSGLYALLHSFSVVREIEHRYAWEIILIGAIIGGPLIAVGKIITATALKSDQLIRDDDGTSSIRHALEPRDGAECEEDLALYLRPFRLDDRSSSNVFKADGFGLEQMTRPGPDTMERVFGDALARSYRTVAIGGEARSANALTGVGMAPQVDDWKKRIIALIKRAGMILVVPLPSKATYWEIGEIKATGSLPKTIFIMPTREIFPEDDFDVKAEWAQAQTEITARFAIALPNYHPAGAVIRYSEGSSRQPLVQKIATDQDPRALARAINRLI